MEEQEKRRGQVLKNGKVSTTVQLSQRVYDFLKARSKRGHSMGAQIEEMIGSQI